MKTPSLLSFLRCIWPSLFLLYYVILWVKNSWSHCESSIFVCHHVNKDNPSTKRLVTCNISRCPKWICSSSLWSIFSELTSSYDFVYGHTKYSPKCWSNLNVDCIFMTRWKVSHGLKTVQEFAAHPSWPLFLFPSCIKLHLFDTLIKKCLEYCRTA